MWESSVKGTERDGEGEGEGKDGQPQEQEQGQDTKREEGLLDGALRVSSETAPPERPVSPSSH